MNTYRMLAVVALSFLACTGSQGQQITAEVPGDHFSLEGALELFKQSESPEEFERLLNSPDTRVNNLDLNGDGYTDYIRVLDRYERNVHAFIIQAVISERENQDIAVIELEKLSNGKAVLQIIGNEDIYGIETILEPTREVRTYAGTSSSRAIVNVWSWPSVQYVYGPYYRQWVSPWGWYRRPVWWHSWRPVAFVRYYTVWRPYRPYYALCDTRRVVYAHHIHYPYRSSSPMVRDRYRHKVERYRSEYGDGRHRDRYGDESYRHAGRPRVDRQRESERPGYSGPRDQRTQPEEGLERRRSELNQQRHPSNGAPLAYPTARDRRAAGQQDRRYLEPRDEMPKSKSRMSGSNGIPTRDMRGNGAGMERRTPYAPERSISREGTIPGEGQRHTSGYRKSETPARTRIITPNAGIRQQAPSQPSSLNRSRELPSRALQERPVTRTRGAGSQYEGNRGID